MLAGQNTGWRHIRGGGLDLILEPTHHIAFAFHHGIEPIIGDLGGIILFGRADGSIQHLRPPEEFRLSSARHETGYRYLGVL